MNLPVPQPLALAPEAMDRLLPMHVVLSASGHVRHAGPTLLRLTGPGILGQGFDALFDLRRPRGASTVDGLLEAPGGRLSLVLRPAALDRSRRAAAPTALKGQALPLTGGGALVNLSFGLASVEAIADHDLTAADFAATDLTVELLYLVEAKAAVMRESSKLNERLKTAKREAEAQALSDTLTGLGNRRALDEALTRMLARGEAFGLIHVDLDFFKDVNDTLGHAAGDFVLAQAARVLLSVTRLDDVVARVGGDEFIVLVRDMTDPARLSEMGERVIERLETPLTWNAERCRISGSVGITASTLYREPDGERMLADADAALYASKRGGRGRVSLADGPWPEGGGTGRDPA